MNNNLKKYKYKKVSVALIIVNILLAGLFIYGYMRMSHSINERSRLEGSKNVNASVENLTYQFGSFILTQDMITGNYSTYIEDENLTMDGALKYLNHWKSFYNDVEIIDLEKREVIHLSNDGEGVEEHEIADEYMQRIDEFFDGTEHEENVHLTPVYISENGNKLVGIYRKINIQGEEKILMFTYEMSSLVQSGMTFDGLDSEKGFLSDSNGEYLWGIQSIPSGETIRVMAYTIPYTGGWSYTYYVDLDEFNTDAEIVRALIIVIVFFALWLIANLIGFYLYKRRIGKLIVLIDEQNEQLRHASDAKTAFVSNMSHEIRTPINTVLGMDEMIIRESTEPVIAGYARDIQKAGRVLLEHINDVLDFSKIESGKLEIIPVEYKPAEVIADLYSMIKLRAAGKYLNFEISWDENIPNELYGDDIRIKQCIINLLTNAVKYTEKGAVKLRVSCKPVPNKNEVELIVKVIDTGIGIKSEDMPYLLEEYQRVDERRNRAIEGTGLGLPMVSRILNLMGSRLEVESVYGEGSTFGFSVVQKIVDNTPSGAKDFSVRRYEENVSASGKLYAPDAHILIIDDTALNLKVVESLLKQTAINIEAVLSGERGIRLCSLTKYDLILVDHRMPGMSGIEFLQEIRTTDGLNANTPVIVLTANVVSGAKEKYLEEGFEGFISKPINPAVLEETIKNALPKELVKEVQSLQQSEKLI